MNIVVARTEKDIARSIELVRGSAVLGCDTETSGLHPSKGRLLSIQFSDGESSVLVPISEGTEPGAFADVLADPAVKKVFHNARFDLAFLTDTGLEVRNVFDSMIAEKVLTKGANQSVALSETLYRYFGIDLDKSKRNRFGRNWNGAWTDELVAYALDDVVFLPRLMREQEDWLGKLGLEADYAALVEQTLRDYQR